MPTQSFPQHLKGKAARPFTLATIYPSTDGVEINYSTDRAAEVAAELGISAEDLEGMEGSGKDGAITVKDVKSWGKEPDA